MNRFANCKFYWLFLGKSYDANPFLPYPNLPQFIFWPKYLMCDEGGKCWRSLEKFFLGAKSCRVNLWCTGLWISRENGCENCLQVSAKSIPEQKIAPCHCICLICFTTTQCGDMTFVLCNTLWCNQKCFANFFHQRWFSITTVDRRRSFQVL